MQLRIHLKWIVSELPNPKSSACKQLIEINSSNHSIQLSDEASIFKTVAERRAVVRPFLCGFEAGRLQCLSVANIVCLLATTRRQQVLTNKVQMRY